VIIAGNSNVSLFRLGKLACRTSPEPVQVHWVGALRTEHFFGGHPAAAKVRESFAREKGWKLLSLGTHDVFSLCHALSENHLPEAQAQLIRLYQSLFRELGNDGKLAWIVFPQPPRQVAFPGLSEHDIVSVATRFYQELGGWCGQNQIAVVNPTGKLVETDGTPKARFLQQDGIHLNASAFDLYADEIALQTGQQLALSLETSRQGYEPSSEPESFALLVAQELGLSWSQAAVEASTLESFEEALLIFLRQRLEERGLPTSLEADTDFVGPRLLDSLDLVETYTYANDLLGAEIDFDVNLRDLNTVRKLAGKLFSEQNVSVDDLLDAARQKAHGGQRDGCAADARIARMERARALRLRDITHMTLGSSIPYGVAHFWLALIEEQAGDRSEALRHLAQASDKGLRFPLLGWRPKHYRRLWQLASTPGDSSQQQEEAFRVSAHEYFLRGELSLDLLRPVENKLGEYADFDLVKSLNQQGEELLHAANYKVAKYAFDKTLEIAPHYGPAYRNLGLLHWKQERPHEADSCFRLAISANAADGQNILAYSEFLLATRRVEEAKAVAGAFFERHPDNLEVAEWLQRQRPTETPVTAQRLSFSLRTTPEAPSMDRLNAEIISAFQHFQQERWEEALTHFQQARKLTPRRQGVHLAIARCLLKLERTSEARVALQEELSIQPNHPDALQLLHELGRESESVPSAPPVALPVNDFLEGAKHFERGDWLEALACFDRVLTKENRKRGVNCLRGQCLLQLGRKAEARQAFKAELSVQQNHPDALRFLQELGHSNTDPAETANDAALYEKGTRLFEAREFSKALECLDEALRQDATLQGARLTRAYCFERMGRLTEAEAAVRQEILQYPENAEARKLFHALRKGARPKKASGNGTSMPQLPSAASI
jgi:tetratricopeptide (TPR) repeat protein